MTLPHVDLGNTYSDVGQGTSTLLKGLLDERARREQLALQEAMVKAKELEATRGRLFPITSQTPEGTLQHGIMDESGNTRVASGPGARAPESQIQVPITDAAGNPQVGFASRYSPGQPVRQATLPPGTTGRVAPPAIITAEQPGVGPVQGTMTRQGPGAGTFHPGMQAGGAPVQPRATEYDERRARDSFEMIQGHHEMKRIAQAAPQAAQEAAAYIAALNIGESVPIIGNEIEALIQQGQSALSPAAAQYYSSFMHFASARAFSRGGATLTRNEINYSLASLAPKGGEDPTTSAMRDRLVNGIVQGATVGNAAWNRYRDMARQLGYDENQALTEPIAPVQKPNRFTGVARP